MSRLKELDKNFQIKSKIDKENIKYYDCREKPFEIYGLILPDSESDYFKRVPQYIADDVNEGVKVLATNTAGGRLCFKTDSKYIAIRAYMQNVSHCEHFPLTATAGFDLYERCGNEKKFIKSYVPPIDISDGYEGIIEFAEGREREYIINFPMYSGVKSLYIGLENSASVVAPSKYSVSGKIVYYGSSITQGGCASRPGNSYQNMIHCNIDCDYINLGFSGSAHGEQIMAEYISGLDMSVFVYDYDFNAQSVELLDKTHEAFFRTVRKKHPDIPVIMISRPTVKEDADADRRFEVIKKTYDHAVSNGDKNVYLIDGRDFFDSNVKNFATVDSIHPTDLGFYYMAQKIEKVIKSVIKNFAVIRN